MMMNLFLLIWFFDIYIFGCKRKGWRMSLYLYRIKGRWTIGQPFNLINIWWWIYFWSHVYVWNYFRFLKGGWRMSFYIIRIKGKWTIEQPFTFYICIVKFIFDRMKYMNFCVNWILVVKEKVDVWAFIL